MVYGFMPGPHQVNNQISVPKGQVIAGNAIGILVLDLWYPYLPGNVANASTFNFPVLYKILKGRTGRDLRSADHAMLDAIVEGGRELEEQGVRAIVGACGFFGNYQKEAAAMLNVPVYISSLLQVPIIRQGLKPNQKVGVITAILSGLTPEILSQCGVNDLSDVVIAGA